MSVNFDPCLMQAYKPKVELKSYIKNNNLNWIWNASQLHKQMFPETWILLPQISSRTGAASLTKNGKQSLYILWMFVWAFTPVLAWFPVSSETENVPTFFGSHPQHFWSVDKISLLFIVNKAAPESVLTAARVLTSHRFSFERVQFIFAVYSGPFRGGETLFLEWIFRLTLNVTTSHVQCYSLG